MEYRDLATLPRILYRLLLLKFPTCLKHNDRVATFSSGWFGHHLCDVCASGFHLPVEEHEYANVIRDLEEMLDEQHESDSNPGT